MASSFNSLGFNLSTTPQILYSQTTGKVCVVILCQAANKTDNNQSVNLIRHDALRNVDVSLAPDIVVPAKSAVGLLTGKLVLMAGDTLLGSAATDSTIDITLSLMEMTQNV